MSKGLLHKGENYRPNWEEYEGGHSVEVGSGTSIFDPVLCEIVYRWFCPVDGSVLDPFAGGSVRGIVAAMLGHKYFGIDLSSTQLKANREQWSIISQKSYANDKPTPIWKTGDARDIQKLVKEKCDLIFTCPPYGNLEVYSDDERDLSQIDIYDDFIDEYAKIINKSCQRLNDNRFACFVVGDYRNKQGFYNNFPGDTIWAFREAGLELYNEAILVTAVGSLPIRVAGGMKNRKLGKTHQNVLIFFKGDLGKIKDDFVDENEDEKD